MANAQIQDNSSIVQSGSLEGYPTQEYHPEDMIASSSMTDNLPYSFIFDQSSGVSFPVLTIPNANVKYLGIWKLLVKHMNPYGAKHSIPFTHIRHEGVSKAVAHEASVGLEASVTAGAKPFGVGVEVSVSASVGYALTLSTEKSSETESGATVTIDPGCGAQWWERELKVNASVPGNYFDKYIDSPQGWLQFYDEIVSPSFGAMAQQMVINKPDLTADNLEASLKALYPRFDVESPGSTCSTVIVSSLMMLKKNGCSASYTLPGKEIFATHYQLAK